MLENFSFSRRQQISTKNHIMQRILMNHFMMSFLIEINIHENTNTIIEILKLINMLK